jgi:toxin ParE1/3/4
MPYLVRLADRALRDMETIYEFIEAGASERAAAWFNSLAEEIYSLERFPERGAIIPETKNFRHLLFGKKPCTYRIIYAVDKSNGVVNVLHIRHGARAALSRKEKRQL